MDPDPGEFCIKQRADWFSYALAHARNRQDAEDAVSHVVEKILKYHAKTGALCPPKFEDPVAWSKKVIANYIKDLDRRAGVQRKYQAKLYVPPPDPGEDVLDELLVRQALPLIKDLKPDDHQVALMHYVENLDPVDIARRLGRNVVTVRTSLWRTNRKIRRQLGIAAEAQKIIPGGDDMTYIICMIAMAALSVVALYVARRYGMGQADERASDDVLRKLYGQYWAQVSAITQTYLLKAPSDEEWLAEIKARVSASDAEVPSRSLWSWLTDHFHDDGASVRQTAAAQLGLEALGAAFRGPLSRIVRMQEKAALIPHRIASGKPESGRRSGRRTSRSNRRFGSGRLTGEVALAAAVTVMAIVVAVAVTAFGLSECLINGWAGSGGGP